MQVKDLLIWYELHKALKVKPTTAFDEDSAGSEVLSLLLVMKIGMS